MHLDIPHKFTITEARSRTKNAIEQAKTQAADKLKITEERWEENTLHFDVTAEGQRLHGTLEVMENTFSVNVKLPLRYRLFEKQIEKAAKEQIAKMLAGGA